MGNDGLSTGDLVKIHEYLAKHFPKESAKILHMHEMYKK